MCYLLINYIFKYLEKLTLIDKAEIIIAISSTSRY